MSPAIAGEDSRSTLLPPPTPQLDPLPKPDLPGEPAACRTPRGFWERLQYQPSPACASIARAWANLDVDSERARLAIDQALEEEPSLLAVWELVAAWNLKYGKVAHSLLVSQWLLTQEERSRNPTALGEPIPGPMDPRRLMSAESALVGARAARFSQEPELAMVFYERTIRRMSSSFASNLRAQVFVEAGLTALQLGEPTSALELFRLGESQRSFFFHALFSSLRRFVLASTAEGLPCPAQGGEGSQLDALLQTYTKLQRRGAGASQVQTHQRLPALPPSDLQLIGAIGAHCQGRKAEAQRLYESYQGGLRRKEVLVGPSQW
ncbi:MAG: hypothetical protein MK135_08360, partial [Polyangiaceae bacterium]|nr:hypothetical protein [Polyangiaceae bacterium]